MSLFVKVYSLLNSPLGNTLAYLTTHAFVILLVIFSQRHFTFHLFVIDSLAVGYEVERLI